MAEENETLVFSRPPYPTTVSSPSDGVLPAAALETGNSNRPSPVSQLIAPSKAFGTGPVAREASGHVGAVCAS